MGILALAEYLIRHGHDVTICDAFNFAGSTTEVEGLLLGMANEWQPDFVCISATHRDNGFIKRMSESKSWPLVVGGPQASFCPQHFDHADYIVIGEGEKSLLDIVEGRQAPGVIQGTKMTADELNEGGPLPYHLLHEGRFEPTDSMIRGKTLRSGMLQTSRGCPYSCTFCSCAGVAGKAVRYLGLDRIERELQALTNLGVEGIWIVDDTFTLSKKRVGQVGALLANSHLIWGCQARADRLDRDMASLLSDHGCVQVDIGVESGSQRMLDGLKKGIKVEEVYMAFDAARDSGMRTLANFMIGLPEETPEDLAMTRGLMRDIKADHYVVSIACPLPGTELHRQVLGDEVLAPEDYDGLNWNGSDLTERLNLSEMRGLKKLRDDVDRSINHPWKHLAVRALRSVGLKMEKGRSY